MDQKVPLKIKRGYLSVCPPKKKNDIETLKYFVDWYESLVFNQVSWKDNMWQLFTMRNCHNILIPLSNISHALCYLSAGLDQKFTKDWGKFKEDFWKKLTIQTQSLNIKSHCIHYTLLIVHSSSGSSSMTQRQSDNSLMNCAPQSTLLI